MVNAVMDAIALLSSLATDLDIMLNDLRSSPGSRLLPPTHHLHQRSASNSSTASSPLTVGGAGGGGNAGSGGSGVDGTGQTTTGYLHSALRSNHNNQFSQQQATNAQRQTFHVQSEKRQQQQSKQAAKVQIIPAAATTTITTTTAAISSIPQRYNRYQYHNQQQQQQQPHKPAQTHRCCASAANACNQAKNRNATTTKTGIVASKVTTAASAPKVAKTQTTTTTTITNSTTRYQQQRHNPHATNRLHTATTATIGSATATSVGRQTTTSSADGSTSGCKLTAIAGNVAPLADETAAAVATHCSGLSAEVRRIEKLPLWSYQHKQLQQPQRLQVQLLQQQRATKAIAVMHTAAAKTTASTSLAGSKVDAVSRPLHLVGGGSSSGSVINGGGPYGASTRVGVASAATTTSVTTLTTAQVLDYTRVDGYGTSGGAGDAFRLNWLQPATIYFGYAKDNDMPRTSDSSTQLTTSAVPPATTHNQLKSTTTIAATAATGNNNNNNNNNSNNNCNSNNAASNRRLPFCGLDSIKGSDSNGLGDGVVGGGGATNLCFDLHGSNSSGGGGGIINASNRHTGAGLVGAHDGMQHDNISEQFHSLDAADSSCCGDGQFEDDMQALLPKCKRYSGDELSQSRTSLVSSSDGGILAEGETSSETSRGTDECPPCDLSLMERLLLTHPVWFLTGIQRSGAVHFLQGKEEGNFIVRGSSQPNTMAVSVRLPPDTGPYIEHYLIQSNDGILSLESSRFTFDSIPALIAHYAQCCDELPVQLVLPRALREVKNRQQLSSLALLGQEFWRYPMSCPKPQESEANLLDAKSPNSLTETSGLGTTVFSSNSAAPQSSKIFSPTSNLAGLFSQAGTPSDTTSSMSSFTTSGGPQMQLMSPESVDSVILTMSPVDANNHCNGNAGLTADNTSAANSNLSTFKSNNLGPVTGKGIKMNADNGIRPRRPKPPNTLNLDLRKPPAPPMRCFKPLTPSSPLPSEQGLNAANNFTVTTTVTFSMENNNSPHFVEVTTPAAANNMITPSALNSNATFQTFSKRLSPEGECKDTLSSQGSSNGSRWQSQSSKDSNHSQRKILSPCSAGTPTSAMGSTGSSKSRRNKMRKESQHYKESDILESPQIYCRSALGDKISDYEDLWTQESNERTGLLTSFKPAEGAQGKRPDLLAETPTITSLSANLLSPANSTATSASPPRNGDVSPTPTADVTACDTQQLIQFSADVQPRSRAGLLLPGLMSQSLSEDQFKVCEPTEGDTTPTADTPASRSKQGSPFYAEPADTLREAGLTTASILRRSQRGPLLPANHRHSEPPKSGLARTPMCPLLIPKEFDKIAGSLDELKKKQQQPQTQQAPAQQQQPTKRARGRFDQWQLDSSWEFVRKQDGDGDYDENSAEHNGNNNYGDYDTEEQWRQQPTQEKENSLGREANKENKQKPLTVHQIIAKHLPDLNLPELIHCSTPPQQAYLQQQHNGQNGQKQLNEHHGSQKSFDSQTGSRLSSYDNVGGTYSFCQSYCNGIDSAQSDDGTVFSEPWDSSQWDSINPQDDATITSDTIHFSKCRPVVSEDDTIIEELSTKESNQDTLKAKKSNNRQKVATILRNPSMRDREILRHPRNKLNAPNGGPGELVRACTLQLAHDSSSTFARNIENFISCTKESREAAPQVVMRNMRQFMNGMKNYLVKHGEGKFHQEIEAARSRLKADEFLNLDAILETVMHELVVLPLREHLYGMFVDYYKRSEDIQLLAQNVKYACGRTPADFGIRATVTPPSPTSLQAISALLQRLQEAELPLEKLDLFLCVISTIFEATGCPRGQQLGADDFLPVLVYVVAKCGFVGAEIEAEFMWGLLQPTLLSGEAGYYLTALCSAVHVLKSFMSSESENGTGSLDWRSSSLPACSSVLRVIIPDECNGSLQTRTLPVRPHTTTRDVCRIIAHKARITNPQDYALFKLVDGEETLLNDAECPQDVRFSAKGKHCMLAYKRIDAKIAWPTTTY